jgi:hypothetical protein
VRKTTKNISINLLFQANMHSGHGFAYDTMRRAEVYSRHPLDSGQDSLALQHSLASSAGMIDHQVCSLSIYFKYIFILKNENPPWPCSTT